MERIRRNKERALEIRRRKVEERKMKEEMMSQSRTDIQGDREETKVKKIAKQEVVASMDEVNDVKVKYRGEEEEDGNLEEFEIGASPHVTKQEAMKKYCLPQGTLEVCTFIEKDNPRQAKWSKMKLYCRDEIRRRSRSRFGGLAGLIEERRKRELKRFERDFEDDIFSKKRKKNK